MSFLSLSALQAAILLAATGLTVVVLYWLKPPPQRVVVPSDMIWKRLMKERRRSSLLDRLRWWLSLLLAMTIGLSVATALGRPEVEALSGSLQRVAVVVDNSSSMLARTADGRSRWEHAVDIAERLLTSGSEGGEFLLADTAGRLASATFGSRREALAGLRSLGVELGVEPSWPPVEDDGARLYFITDGVSFDAMPESATVVSVFEPTDNVAITALEVRPVPSDLQRHQAYMEVVNLSQRAKDVTVQLSGTGDNRLRSTIGIAPGESFGGTFDLSEFGRGPVRATLSAEGDGFALDDEGWSWLPVRSRTRVVLISRGNLFLEALLGLDPRVSVRRIPPDEYAAEPVADVLVYDRYAPPVAPSRPALLFAPPRVSWLPAIIDVVEAPAVEGWDRGHPLLEYVGLEDLAVDRAVRVRLDADAASSAVGGPAVLVGSRRMPLVVVADQPSKWIEVTFALDESNFAVQQGFPIFLGNALSWLTDQELALQRPLGRVEVPLAGARVVRQDGAEVEARTVLDGTVFDAVEPGLYTVVGGARRLHVAVNLADRRVSDVNDTSLSPAVGDPLAAVLGSSAADDGWPEELWFFLTLAAALLVTAEWFTFHRRWTV